MTRPAGTAPPTGTTRAAEMAPATRAEGGP
jgi:hypothetical protein